MGQLIEGIVKNVSGEKFSFVEIKFTLFDSRGNQIGTAFDIIMGLGANSTWKFSAEYYDENASTFQFDEITAY